MKILLVSLSNNYDHQLSLYSLYEEMMKLGEDVYTCGIFNPKVEFDFSERNVFVDAPKRPGLSFATLKTGKMKPVINLIKEKGIDTIYFESLHTWNLLLMKKKYHLRVFHCLHDLIPHKGKNATFVSMFNKIVFKKTNCVILRGKFSVDYCKFDEKLSKYNVEFLPLGRKWIEYRPVLHTKNVMFFGRITSYKGIKNLVEIVKTCKDVNFQIVGQTLTKKDEKLLNEIRTLSNVTMVNDYVCGESMEKYFSDSDVVILPYLSSTQSGVVVDSYRLSRPCIAFDVGDLSNQIVDGKTGFVVEKENVDDFIKAIYKFLDLDSSSVDKMSLEAYNFGKNEYSSSNVAIKLVSILKSTY